MTYIIFYMGEYANTKTFDLSTFNILSNAIASKNNRVESIKPKIVIVMESVTIMQNLTKLLLVNEIEFIEINSQDISKYDLANKICLVDDLVLKKFLDISPSFCKEIILFSSDFESCVLDSAVLFKFKINQVLSLPRDSEKILQLLNSKTSFQDSNCGYVVLGAAGGVGSSILSLGLAVELALQEENSLLLDSSMYGGGLSLLAGVAKQNGLHWGDFDALKMNKKIVNLYNNVPKIFKYAGILSNRLELENSLIFSESAKKDFFKVLEQCFLKAGIAKIVPIVDLKLNEIAAVPALFEKSQKIIIVTDNTAVNIFNSIVIAKALTKYKNKLCVVIRGERLANKLKNNLLNVTGISELHLMKSQYGIKNLVQTHGLKALKKGFLLRTCKKILQ